MREVHISRAEGDGVEPIVIRIERELPAIAYGDPDYARKAYEDFQFEGAALAAAICASCPGGTIDALLVALLTRRASLFRVAFPQE